MKYPEFKGVKKEEYTSLTDERIEALRKNAEDVATENKAEWSAYWSKGKAIKEAIESLFPTKRKYPLRGKPREEQHKLMKYARKVLEENSPNSYYNNMRPFEDFLAQVNKAKSDAKYQEARKEREQEALQEARDRQLKAIRFAAVRGWMDVETADDFIDHATDEDKYLDLAMNMEATRMSWIDGFYRVENALQRFKVEDERDQLIYDDVQSCMDSDDGRAFRDAEWNYNKLYELVDSQLLEEFNQVVDWEKYI